MFPNASDYEEDKLKACQSVLVEVIHLLGDYVDDIAIVGGWVPTLLLPHSDEKHIGTMDVDIALNRENINDEAYSTIHKILTKSGYVQSTKRGAQFKYIKEILINSHLYRIEVDLLTGEYGGGTGKKRRHEPVQDVMALKARGVDFVFGRTEPVQITAELPGDGGRDTVKCRVAGVVPFIVMKSIVLVRRKKEKDAYDLVFLIRHFPGGGNAIVKLLRPDIENGLVLEALKNLREKFSSPDDYGPAAVAHFLGIDEKSERDIIRQQAFQTIDQFLRILEDCTYSG